MFDAFRHDERTPQAARAELVEELRRAGVTGRLAYTALDCSFRVRLLPEFRPVRSPRRFEGAGCRFGAPTQTLEVATPSPLTLHELEEAAARHPVMPDDLRWLRRVAVVDVARLDRGRLAVVVELRFTGRLAQLAPSRVLALFHGRRLVAAPLFEPIERIAASRDGRYVAVEPGRLVRGDGTTVAFPRGLEDGGALAFSPDGRWLAVARLRSVFLVPLVQLDRFDGGGPSPDVIRLPLAARDLAWR